MYVTSISDKGGSRGFMKIILFISGIAISNAASAASPNWNMVYAYPQAKGSDFVAVYLSGAGYAYGAANASLEYGGQKKLFCQPTSLALTSENYISVFEKKLESYSKDQLGIVSNATIEHILLFGLQDTFPCL